MNDISAHRVYREWYQHYDKNTLLQMDTDFGDSNVEVYRQKFPSKHLSGEVLVAFKKANTVMRLFVIRLPGDTKPLPKTCDGELLDFLRGEPVNYLVSNAEYGTPNQFLTEEERRNSMMETKQLLEELGV